MYFFGCLRWSGNALCIQKIKDKITPEINAKVEDMLNKWFGVEYELVKYVFGV